MNPSWCSSTCQFGNGIHKSFNLPGIPQASAAATEFCTTLWYSPFPAMVLYVVLFTAIYMN